MRIQLCQAANGVGWGQMLPLPPLPAAAAAHAAPLHSMLPCLLLSQKPPCRQSVNGAGWKI